MEEKKELLQEVTIVLVENGYLVYPFGVNFGEPRISNRSELLVFEDMDGLKNFLEERLKKPEFNFLQKVRNVIKGGKK